MLYSVSQFKLTLYSCSRHDMVNGRDWSFFALNLYSINVGLIKKPQKKPKKNNEKSSYTVIIDFIPLFAFIRHLKKKRFSYSYCNDVGTVTSLSVINIVVPLVEIHIFLLLGNLSILYICNNLV
jgi:hypothetical protein